LPSIATELHADTRGLQWVVDGYNLTFAALVLAAGSLADRYGRRPALLIGLLGFAVTSAVGALANSTGALIAARFSMGAFAALIFPTTLSIITNTFADRRQRATALGGWGAVVGAGVAAGPVTGGLLLEHFSWSSVFWALVPPALLAAVLAFFLVPESRDPGVPALDIRGLTTSIALLGVFVYTVIEAPVRGWISTATLFGFVAAAALALAFVMIEQAAQHPMLDVRLFTDRRFSAASASVTVTFFSLSGFIFLITQYFQVLRGFNPLATGARILPVALSIAVGSVVGGLLAPRIGTRAVVVSGLASFGTAMAWIAAIIDTNTPYWSTIVADAAHGPRHRANLHSSNGFHHARTSTGSSRYRLGSQRCHPRVGLDIRRGHHRVVVLISIRCSPHRRRIRRDGESRCGRQLGANRVRHRRQ
jgi:EmrB/QacA subfamily drug resistance transporter